MDEGHDKSRPTRVVGGIGAFHGRRMNWRGAAWAVVERLPVSSSTNIHTNHWLGGCADDGLCIQGLLVRIPLSEVHQNESWRRPRAPCENCMCCQSVQMPSKVA